MHLQVSWSRIVIATSSYKPLEFTLDFLGRVADPGLAVFTSYYLTYGYTYASLSSVEYAPLSWIVEDRSVAVVDGIGYSVWTTFDLTRIETEGALRSVRPYLQTFIFI